MPSRRMISISVLFVGIILTLAACGVESDVPAPSASTMTNEELVLLIQSSPYSVTYRAETEVDKALKENPSMTSEEQTILLKELLVDMNEQIGESTEEELAPLQSSQFKKWFTLTSEERVLCVAYPVKCNKTNNYATEAWNLAEEREPVGQALGPQDAFRHAYWNSAMCSRIDFNWARRFATAHEAGKPANAETEMDYFNNAVGRSICTDYRIARRMSKAIDDGDLEILIGGPNARLVDSDHPWP